MQGSDGSGNVRLNDRLGGDREWLKENAPGGWIDDLRRELKSLREAVIAYRSEMENPVENPVMVQRRRRQLFALIP